MAHVNAQEVTIPWRKRTDVISLFLKAYPEDFEVDEVSEDVDEKRVLYKVDEEALLRAMDSAKPPKTRHHVLTRNGAEPSEVAQDDVDESKGQVKPELDRQMKLIIGESGYNKINVYGQDILETLLTEGFEAAKPIMERGWSESLEKADTFKKHDHIYIYRYMNIKYPFLDVKLDKDPDTKETRLRLGAHRRLLALKIATELDVEQWIAFCLLAQGIKAKETVTIEDAKGWDKKKRTAFYQLLSRDFSFMQARTVTVGQGPDQVIEVRWKPDRKRKRGDDNEARSSSEVTISLHLAFTLTKHNMDHHSAVEALARALQLPTTAITYAGMKDCRAVTSQRMVASLAVPSATTLGRSDKLAKCRNALDKAVEALGQASSRPVERMDAASLCREGRGVQIEGKAAAAQTQGLGRGIAMSGFHLADKPMHLGQLRGNRFRLFLRGVSQSQLPHLRMNLDSSVAGGFVNFYGSQRFSSSFSDTEVKEKEDGGSSGGGEGGSSTMPFSPRLGEMILSGRHSEIAGFMLSHLASKNSLYLPASERLAEPDSTYREAIALLPSEDRAGRPSVEKAYLKNLERFGAYKVPGPHFVGRTPANPKGVEIVTTLDGDNERAHVKAARMISHFHRTLWVTSYQSWLWNGAVSARIARHGTLPIPGDLVTAEAGDPTAADGASARVITRAELDMLSPSQLRELAFRVVIPLFGTAVRLPSWDGVEEAATELYPAELMRDNARDSGGATKEGGSDRAVKLPKGGYRAVLARVTGASLAEAGADCCELAFRLPPGSFATSLVSQIALNEKLL